MEFQEPFHIPDHFRTFLEETPDWLLQIRDSNALLEEFDTTVYVTRWSILNLCVAACRPREKKTHEESSAIAETVQSVTYVTK